MVYLPFSHDYEFKEGLLVLQVPGKSEEVAEYEGSGYLVGMDFEDNFTVHS